MTEVLQEFVDSGSQRLRVDRAAGIIRGVKLLGLTSRNGRRYRESALTDAVGLYEGAKVNINHPKGHPLSPRDYQDRLGVMRGVHFRSGEGLFGELHFNPMHALSEQLVWDAEHAPQNVGMSHNVLARTSVEGSDVVVEAITKVQSIDLVADPATTSGLYEHAESSGVEEQASGEAGNSSTIPRHSTATLASLTLAELQHYRPDLVRAATLTLEQELTQARTQLEALATKEETARRRDRILQLLEQHGLPLPTPDGTNSKIVSEQFVESLMTTTDQQAIERLIQERAALVRSASTWNGGGRPSDRRPRSKDQAALAFGAAANRVGNGREFASALRSQ